MGERPRTFDLGGRDRRPRLRVPLTPLIDIIFLLVMFFLLSSTFSDLRVLRIGLARISTAGLSGTAAESQAAEPAARAPVYITVARTAGGSGVGQTTVEVDGRAVDLADLRAHLDRLAADGALSAVVRARPGTSIQDVVSVLDAARASSLAEVGILAGR